MSSNSMLNCYRQVGYAALISLGWVCLAIAGQPGAVTVALRAELRVPQGKGSNSYSYIPATKIEQGQEIDYTVRITNPGASPLVGASVVQALPANTRYVAGSATGAGADIQFSVDGGRSFGKPRALKSPSNASLVASAKEYTHIRWQLRYPLAPKVVVLARFRAVFE
jgi:uncharacterized repeat protein (TIGR01451 family)